MPDISVKRIWTALKPEDPDDLLVAVSKEWKARKAQKDCKIIPFEKQVTYALAA